MYLAPKAVTRETIAVRVIAMMTAVAPGPPADPETRGDRRTPAEEAPEAPIGSHSATRDGDLETALRKASIDTCHPRPLDASGEILMSRMQRKMTAPTITSLDTVMTGALVMKATGPTATDLARRTTMIHGKGPTIGIGIAPRDAEPTAPARVIVTDVGTGTTIDVAIDVVPDRVLDPAVATAVTGRGVLPMHGDGIEITRGIGIGTQRATATTGAEMIALALGPANCVTSQRLLWTTATVSSRRCPCITHDTQCTSKNLRLTCLL